MCFFGRHVPARCQWALGTVRRGQVLSVTQPKDDRPLTAKSGGASGIHPTSYGRSVLVTKGVGIAPHQLAYGLNNPSGIESAAALYPAPFPCR